MAKREIATLAHLNRLLSMLTTDALNGPGEARGLLKALLKEPERFTRYGLAVGSSDIVGVVRSMSGSGIFLAMELKSPTGRASKEQRQWLAIVNGRGGVGREVRSVEEAGAAIAEARAL